MAGIDGYLNVTTTDYTTRTFSYIPNEWNTLEISRKDKFILEQ